MTCSTAGLLRVIAPTTVLAVTLVFSPLASSAAGELDPTFDGDGKVVTDFGGGSDYLLALAVQSDGKIIAAGETHVPTPESKFALARYQANGSLDGDFGVNGKVTTSFDGRSAYASAVAVQADGKIVAAGDSFSFLDPSGPVDIAVARYMPDGALDDTFGVGGKAVTDFSSSVDGATALAIQSDGKLVVGGLTRPPGPITTNPYDFALVRFNPDGSLDTTFDGDGRVVTDFEGSEDWAWGLDIAPDGKIVQAGYELNRGASSAGIEIARYNVDGSLDSAFDGDGKVLDKSAMTSGAYDVVVEPDGAVTVAGQVYGESSRVGGDLALVRYTSSGDLDASFGVGGIANVDFGMEASTATGLARQPDGRLVAAGYASPDAEPTFQTDGAFALARFSSTGKLDESFYGGEVLTHIGEGTDDAAEAVVVQPDGRIVAGGYSAPLADPIEVRKSDFALVRYLEPLPSSPPPLPPPPSPPPAAPPPPPPSPTPTPPPTQSARCVVPNVKGKSVARAKAALRARRCAPGRIKYAFHKTIKKGRVIAQSKRPGTRHPRNTKVHLIVSKGRRSR